MYKTNKEIGAEIRAKLKAAGIPARSVSVRVSDAGYSTAVNVEIKDITVGCKGVEDIVNGYESIRRDERSYEILEGCNTYVNVRYDYDMMDAACGPYMDRAREIIANHPACGTGIEIARNEKTGTHATYFWTSDGSIENTVEVFDDRKRRFSRDLGRYAAYNEYVLAEALALFAAHGKFTA